MNVPYYLSGSFNLIDIYKSIVYKRKFRKEHPEYFDPDGILVFCGAQGEGKTLSMVQYAYKLALRYPDHIVVTNMQLNNWPVPVYPYTGLNDLSKYSNGYAGVLFLIDEIQIEFNSLESKKIDPSVITEIAQQRKQRKHIVGTSQVFNRIAKPFREQFRWAVLCRCFFGCIQFNSLIDGSRSTVKDDGTLQTSGVRRYFWFHSPVLYTMYNTYAKILRTNLEGFGYGH